VALLHRRADTSSDAAPLICPPLDEDAAPGEGRRRDTTRPPHCCQALHYTAAWLTFARIRAVLANPRWAP